MRRPSRLSLALLNLLSHAIPFARASIIVCQLLAPRGSDLAQRLRVAAQAIGAAQLALDSIRAAARAKRPAEIPNQ